MHWGNHSFLRRILACCGLASGLVLGDVSVAGLASAQVVDPQVADSNEWLIVPPHTIRSKPVVPSRQDGPALGHSFDYKVNPRQTNNTLPQISASELGQEVQASPVQVLQKEAQHGDKTPQDPLPPNVVPIGLDTVLRLAEEQNAQIGIAREKVQEAYAGKDLAASRWLPDVYVGTAYYRHEGGIQNEDGTLTHSSMGAMFAGMELNSKLDLRDYAYQKVNAQRMVWQQRGELSRVTSQTLLDASSTYIDLLTAKTGEAIAQDLSTNLNNLLVRAQKLVTTEPGARVEVSRIQAELDGQRQTVIKLRAQGAAAAAKLIYLLGLDPSAELVPVDPRIVPIDLVDATPPAGSLVAQALASGPGIREMEGLLALINDSMERSKGPAKFVPIIETRMAEGGFGAGPGDSMSWDHRWDLGVQARWNLTELVTQQDRQRAARAKVQQAHLAYQDLRGKLAAGVEEARESILSGREEISLAEGQIRNARRAFELSDLRLKEIPQPSSYSEELLAISALGRAQTNFLTSISAYDKAQLRLMVLLGSTTGPHSAPRCPVR